jgi:Domain of unknown function (DUF222)/HNH endonuclease
VVVAGIDAAIAASAATPIDQLSDADLGEGLVALRRGIDRLEAEFARWLEAFDRRHAFRGDGSTSAIAWLRNRCGLSGGAAATRVEVARELKSVPGAVGLFRAGGIGFDSAAALSRTAAEVGRKAAGLAGEVLVDAAARLQPEQCRDVGRQLRHVVDPEGELAQELRQHCRRRFSLSQARDGMYLCEGLLDAEGGALLRTALVALDPPLPGEERTPAQRRADALVELATRQLQAGSLPSRQGQRPQLLLTVSQAGLRGRPGEKAAELRYAGPVSTAAARRIACDAAVTEVHARAAQEIAVATSGHDGSKQALAVPPAQRTVAAWMRRALIRRDRECCFPGCDRGPEWCDVHHIIHRADGGPTKLWNLVLLCRTHHRSVHEDGWALTGRDGIIEVRPPPRE